MTDTCPNCGSTDVDELNIHDELWCGYCGTWWCARDEAAVQVPRRSQPAEVKALPDNVGVEFWWHFENTEWRVRRVSFDIHGNPGFADRTVRSPCRPGRYVRCEPPIVRPEPVDDDAAKLRTFASYLGPETKLYGLTKDDAARIADRLEAKEPT